MKYLPFNKVHCLVVKKSLIFVKCIYEWESTCKLTYLVISNIYIRVMVKLLYSFSISSDFNQFKDHFEETI